MTDYIHLIGAEEVSNAGRSIATAAHDMQRAANQIDEAMGRHRRFMEQWLVELRTILEELPINKRLKELEEEDNGNTTT